MYRKYKRLVERVASAKVNESYHRNMMNYHAEEVKIYEAILEELERVDKDGKQRARN